MYHRATYTILSTLDIISSRYHRAWITSQQFVMSTVNKVYRVILVAFRITSQICTRHVDYEIIFAPNQLRTYDYWISTIAWYNDFNISVSEILRPKGNRPLPLNHAILLLEHEWDISKSKYSNEVIPIFCYHNVDPIFTGVRALMLSSLPESIERDISMLRLSNPIDLHTPVGPADFGILGMTTIDIQPDRFVAIGNAASVCSTLAVLGKRLSIPKDPVRAASCIRNAISKHSMAPVGSSLIISGLGAVFTFEAAILYSKIQGIDPVTSKGLLFSCMMSMVGILGFLVQEAFESRIVAYSSYWTLKFKLASWYTFIAILLITPVTFFMSIDNKTLCEFTRWSGSLLMVLCLICSIGQIYFRLGLSRTLVWAWWGILSLGAIFLPLLD